MFIFQSQVYSFDCSRYGNVGWKKKRAEKRLLLFIVVIKLQLLSELKIHPTDEITQAT